MRGKIKVFENNYLVVLTEHCNEETTDMFSFDELLNFILTTKGESE